MSNKGVNKVILLGRIGQDPEVRFMPNGEAVANFTMATSESWQDQQGQKQERTEWHRLVAFRKLAEIISQYVHKGSQLYVEGKLQTREWQDQQGQKRYTTEIVIDEMQMLDPKPTDQANGYLPDQARQAQQQRPAPRPAAAPQRAPAPPSYRR